MLVISRHICPKCGGPATGFNGGIICNPYTEAVCSRCGHKFTVTPLSGVQGLLKRIFK